MEGLTSPTMLKSTVTAGLGNSHLRRFQLLRYRDLTRLRDVMETIVPIHGTGNFPTLEIRPSQLVQVVRERLENIGIKVRDVRLNGSAATHVLSDDETLTYKDLDLIFAIDFPDTEGENRREAEPNKVNCSELIMELINEERFSNFSGTSTHALSSLKTSQLPKITVMDGTSEYLTRLEDSGYTSSGSSTPSTSSSPSPSHAFLLKKNKKRLERSRTRSLESTSSSSSVHFAQTPCFHPEEITFPSKLLSNHHIWQEIKDATMDVLMDFLPKRVRRTKMTSVVLGSAYVQKMVKVSNESDKWSLISLNNNSGRNLELKFVQCMKRQFEFSVDSFQIILDSYLSFYEAAAENDEKFEMTQSFHPTVIAESVYGDFAAALRHLRQHRICTHRPEEIRGGGLLRYCNLIARDFKPGDCEASEESLDAESSSSGHFEVEKLEQHMCSRFFIDFNDIDTQRKKLISYLESHFVGEEDLKFQYLLVLRRVVDSSTVCLMQHEKNMIIDLITMLTRQTLANNVARSSTDAAIMQRRIQQEFCHTTRKRYFERMFQSYGGLSATPLLSCPSSSVNNCFNAACPRSHSRPLSPAMTYYGPYKCNIHATGSHELYREVLPNHNNFTGTTECCACYFCTNHQHANAHHVPPTYYSPQDPYLASTIQPIYYNPDHMTCYYEPANFKEASKV